MSRQEQFKKHKEVQADEIPEQNQRRFFLLLQHLVNAVKCLFRNTLEFRMLQYGTLRYTILSTSPFKYRYIISQFVFMISLCNLLPNRHYNNILYLC
jgi:hypothetical protein